MGRTDTEVERARGTLRHLVELSGMSQREVKKHLVEQGSRTDLPRVLSGRLDLKLRHILDIVHILGLHPQEFFRMVFKEPEQRSPFLERLEDLISPSRIQPSGREPRAGSPPEDLDDLRQRLAKLAREVEQLKATGQTRGLGSRRRPPAQR